MSIRLTERDPRSNEKREILISKDEFLIGRGADCDLRLFSETVSRHHCMIRTHGEECSLMDLGSSNGTYLNGQRVRSQTSVKYGDELQVGSFKFTFGEDDSEGVNWGSETGVTGSDVTQKFSSIPKDDDKA